MSSRFVRIALIGSVVVGLTGCNALMRAFMSPEGPPEGQAGLSLAELPEGALSVVAEGLQVPWDLVFLPEGGFLVSERRGRVTRFEAWEEGDAPLRPEDGQVRMVDGVSEGGEGGLMGMAIHPGFSVLDPASPNQASPPPAGNQWVYLMLTTEGPEGLENRVER